MHRPTCSQVTCPSLDLKVRKAVPWRKFESAAAWGEGWILYGQTRNLFMIVRMVDSLTCWKRGNNCWEERKRTKGSCEVWKTLPRLKNQIEIDPQRIMGVEWCHLDYRAGDISIRPHMKTSWISIHKRKWLWDGSEIQLRACVNTGEQKGRINEQKGLGGISLDEMAGNKEDWGICISYTACAVADPSGQLCEGLQWPLPLRAYTAPVAAAASPQLSQQRSL